MANIMRVGGGGGEGNKSIASVFPKLGVTYTNGISDLDEGTLNVIAFAISNNNEITKDTSVIYWDWKDAHRKISVGDTQNISVDGTSYAANIIGFNHDELSIDTAYGKPTATGKAGMTFQLLGCLAKNQLMNNSNTNAGGWASCVMRNTNMVTIMSQIPTEFRSFLKSVKKLTSVGGNSSTIGTTTDTLFLLSEIEIFGSLTHSFSGEGSQYAYYKAGNSKIKTSPTGSATPWWGRSPAKDAISFCLTTNTGAAAGVNSGASAPIGASFGYCF